MEPDGDDQDRDGDRAPVVHDVATIERDAELNVDTLGLHVAEAKDLLQRVQEVVIDEQVRGCLAEQMDCQRCGRQHAHKDTKTIVMRTLFGTVRLASPRWCQCPCQSQPTRTFCPLAAALPERATPELVYLEGKFAGLVSYGQTASLLAETLPLGRTLHASAVRLHVLATAERLENELGPGQPIFADGCQRDFDAMPRPDLPLTVGLDGGYVHSSQQRSKRDGWFEVIAGKSIPTEGPAKCFGFVQTYDAKPKRRLFEVLRSQGMTMNQQVTFFTDGGDDVRELPLYLNPHSEHYLDWFHIAMRITVMSQLAKGLRAREDSRLAETVLQYLERLKWFLWHGNLFQALQTVDGLELDLDGEGASLNQRRLLKAVREFGGYLRANNAWISNYGERYRNGETISSAFVESAVNQVVSKRMVKKQQMRWAPRTAHLLLQVRTTVLNDDLGSTFKRWYPAFVSPPAESAAELTALAA
ncbi:MAG: ISKra4 family transposase [Chloroflexi bacterium]|nr:ISKra4 family transposase [Chloroflexota bacterium]